MSHSRQQDSDGSGGGHRTETRADDLRSPGDGCRSGQYVTDGGRTGTALGDGFDLDELVRVAALAAVAVAVVQILLSIVISLIGGGSLINVSGWLSQLIGIVGSLAFVGAIVAVAVVGTQKQVVLWGSVAIYALGLLDSILSSFVNSIMSPARAGLGLGLNSFLFPLYSVVTFLGIVMAYRLYQGKTVLPGVDVRL